MPVVWHNTFDGPNGVALTVANSADYGDPVSNVYPDVVFDSSWSVEGSASIAIGNGTFSGIRINDLAATEITVRMCFRLPANQVDIALFADNGDNVAVTFDGNNGSVTYPGGSAPAGTLASAFFRAELQVTATDWTLRVYTLSGTTPYGEWSGPITSTGPWDLLIEDFGGAPLNLDEVMVRDDSIWIGPPGPFAEGTATGGIVLAGTAAGEALDRAALGTVHTTGTASGTKTTTGTATGGIVLTGTAAGEALPLEPLPPAEASPVADMWIGPLGAMRRIAQRAGYSREPALGGGEFTALSGRVTTSRARWAPRRGSLAWDRLTPADRDWLYEVALVGRAMDTTVEVIDPATRNLLAAEHSRGRPLAGVTGADGVSELYTLDGGGSLTVGAGADGQRYAAVSGAAAGATLVWLHSYHGAAGWPVLPGWPVYLGLQDLGGGSIYAGAELELVFHNHAGARVGYAIAPAGAGLVTADAPPDAAAVSPRAVLPGGAGLQVIGGASLTYHPPDAVIPLGDGCPTYSVTGISEDVELPWYTVSLDVVEVRSHATR